MIDPQEIESFMHGNDPEEFIVAIEFDYASNSIYKIKEIPGKGKEIRKDQIEGGMVGQYNPSITQRLNALKEHVEQHNIEQPLFPDVRKNDSNKQDS